MEPLNILFRNEEMKLVILWSIQKGEEYGLVFFYEDDGCGRAAEYSVSQMTKCKFSYDEHEQLAKEGMTKWDM